jgi:oxygen-independent coproporphyrinogen-3 oxidase
MLTSILRIMLTRSLKPFIFKSRGENRPVLDLKNLGLYIHIPFCRKLCAFCPYYKVKYDKSLMEVFIGSLLKEIDLIKENNNRKYSISSIYFGGGSPALAADRLPLIISKIKTVFDIRGNSGIELHPRDIDPGLLKILRRNGFDMASIGVQSFLEKCLLSLGREITDSRKKVRMAARAGFKVIDTDLIFGIPGQTPEDLAADFETAARYGATQISTYPFIEFSYTGLRERPADKDTQKKMLDCLLEVSKKMGFERSSVWTFLKKGSKPYSSVTRDNYIGLGPSAATLTRDLFKINTFSVSEYIACLSQGRLPTALTLRFNDRRRALYWLFWSSYNLHLDRKSFRELFGLELDSFFRPEIFIGKRLGFLKENEKGYGITEKGADLYHKMEQVYTHQYIDKTWRISLKEPWPKKLVLY